MIVLGLDPGTNQSALVAYDGTAVGSHMTLPNDRMLSLLGSSVHPKVLLTDGILVVEKVESYGMPVGVDVFTTVFTSGRFVQTWEQLGGKWAQLGRLAVKMHLCGSPRAKDANIRQALMDRFGGENAFGRKHSQGPLYGISGHELAALAVAVTWWDREVRGQRKHDGLPLEGN